MDIVRLPIEYKKDTLDSRFRLVVIASQRARELAFGAKPKIETRYRKIPTIALVEALDERLEYLTGKEASIANEEAKKFDYKRFLEEKKKEALPEDLSELERDLRVYLHEREEFDRQAIEDLFNEKDAGKEEEGA
jgi:DNA-directed RNA polymerase subunit omega